MATVGTAYDRTSTQMCKPNSSLSGAFCELCADEHSFFHPVKQRCSMCGASLIGFFFGLLICIIVAGVLVWLAWRRIRPKGSSVLAHFFQRLRAIQRRWAVSTKFKIVVSFTQIVSQLDDVFRLRYPPAYQGFIQLLRVVNLEIFGWIPGLHLKCFGLMHMTDTLYFSLVSSLAVVAVIFSAAKLSRYPMVDALPYTLAFLFLIFPSTASQGFRVLSLCDCFHHADGSQLCFLHSDSSIECTQEIGSSRSFPPTPTLTAAVWVIFAFAFVVPALYGALLFLTRRQLAGLEPSTKLSASVAFITRDYGPRAFWW